jgi:hypothetical protein
VVVARAGNENFREILIAINTDDYDASLVLSDTLTSCCRNRYSSFWRLDSFHPDAMVSGLKKMSPTNDR